MSSLEARRDEFRQYLEDSGVIGALTKCLVKLYEAEEKPVDAILFVQQNLSDKFPNMEEFEKLQVEFNEAKETICRQELELQRVQGEVRPSTSLMNMELHAGMDQLEKDGDCKSLLKKYLTRELLESLKDLQTAHKSNLLDVIRSGLENHDSYVGVYAPDPDAYKIFSPLFNPIIGDYHGVSTFEDPHPVMLLGDPNAFQDLDPNNEFIISTRVRCARSISGIPFAPRMSEDDYATVENQLRNVLEEMGGEFKGTYHSLTKMSKEDQEQLINDNLLFKDGDKLLSDANAHRFWPNGRGIFMNEQKNFLVWCNAEDHIRIISMDKGGNLARVYERFAQAIEQFGDKIQFARDDHLGYLNFCPTNLGTAIRASVHIKLPKLSKDADKLEEIANKFHLHVRGIEEKTVETKEGIYNISNKRRMGVTEFDLVKGLFDGILEIIETEQKLTE